MSMIDECRYVPGSGEDEGEKQYFGKTTQNTAYPVTPSSNSSPSRGGTGGGGGGGGGGEGDTMLDTAIAYETFIHCYCLVLNRFR